MKTPYVNLKLQWKKERSRLLPIIEKILSEGTYVIGKEVDNFEKKAPNHIKDLCNQIRGAR